MADYGAEEVILRLQERAAGFDVSVFLPEERRQKQLRKRLTYVQQPMWEKLHPLVSHTGVPSNPLTMLVPGNQGTYKAATGHEWTDVSEAMKLWQHNCWHELDHVSVHLFEYEGEEAYLQCRSSLSSSLETRPVAVPPFALLQNLTLFRAMGKPGKPVSLFATESFWQGRLAQPFLSFRAGPSHILQSHVN